MAGRQVITISTSSFVDLHMACCKGALTRTSHLQYILTCAYAPPPLPTGPLTVAVDIELDLSVGHSGSNCLQNQCAGDGGSGPHETRQPGTWHRMHPRPHPAEPPGGHDVGVCDRGVPLQA